MRWNGKRRRISLFEEKPRHAKTTKREAFLAELVMRVPWQNLCALVAPYYPTGGAGRPPVPLERMLRLYFVQQWFSLSDPGTEEAVTDSISMRAFIGIDFDDPVPDETTICKFRHLLERNGLDVYILREVDRWLGSRCVSVTPGSIVEPTAVHVRRLIRRWDRLLPKPEPEEAPTMQEGKWDGISGWYYGMREQLETAQRERSGASPIASVIGPQATAKESRHLTPDEAARLLELATATPWRTHIEILLATGLRRGELLGLRWVDCDLDREALTVRSSLSDANGVVKLKGTKTDKARTVPLSPLAVEALRRQRVAQAREKLAAGPAYEDQGFVFADPLGKPTVPDNLTKAFAKLARQAGIPDVTLHSTRHSTATWLLSGGVDVHSVQTILGHSVPSRTLNIYGHAVAGLQAQAVAKIDAHLRGAQERRQVAGEQG